MLPHKTPSMLKLKILLLSSCPTMWHFLLKSLKKFYSKGFEDFVTYLIACPIRYALDDVADPFLPQHGFEFYYTSAYYNTEVIVGALGHGEHNIVMTMIDFQRSLRLPIQDEYFPLPSMDECCAVLEKLDYDFDAQYNHNVLRMHLPTTWKFLTGVIGKCLTHKMRSLDQMNSFEQHILLSVIKNKQLDFNQLIFDQIDEIIKGSKRSTNVPYPWWFAQIFQYFGNDQQPPPGSSGAPSTGGTASTIHPPLHVGPSPSNLSPLNNTPLSSPTPQNQNLTLTLAIPSQSDDGKKGRISLSLL
ncbi:unnamed protein product [Lactuca virosa]|uniref:Uncharacterized protein n=1 Tax=Lactuca virosa TaxID=75947 RepID=A0AAU9M552_9ASTR|nr:unnamed protein product [Lactuca virosa]